MTTRNFDFYSSDPQSIDWSEFAATLDWTPVRSERRLEDWLLLEQTEYWLSTLPLGARPLILQRKFARIANKLCRLWTNDKELATYFKSLLENNRPFRKGFPPLVREELFALSVYSVVMQQAGRADSGFAEMC